MYSIAHRSNYVAGNWVVCVGFYLLDWADVHEKCHSGNRSRQFLGEGINC